MFRRGPLHTLFSHFHGTVPRANVLMIAMKFTRVAAISLMLLLAACQAPAPQKAPPQKKVPPKMRAGFIYSGPADDMGWNRAHETGRRFVQVRLPWLETVVRESVPAANAMAAIDGLIRDEQCRVVFLTSQIYGMVLQEAWRKYPGRIFMHCSGVRRFDNAGTYYIDIYQVYYLNGLMAGALTESNKIGYVGAFPEPGIIRHINAFALGVKEVNPGAVVEARWLRKWFDPVAAESAANGFVRDGFDVIAFTEDSAAIIKLCQRYFGEGRRVLTFGHYGPMQSFGPDVVVSGHMVEWGPLYRKILEEVRAGNWRSQDYLWTVREDAAVLGAVAGVPVNPKFVPALEEFRITSPDFGPISVYELVMRRLEQMRRPVSGFDPFTGPLEDREGRLRLQEGATATREMLWSMDWFVSNVEGSLNL